MFRDWYSGKTVLVTGHTGFKGAWLSLWLNELGAKVQGISLPPVNSPNLFSIIGIDSFTEESYLDIRHKEEVSRAILRIKPDFIFHLAAQSLVRESYANPLATLDTNVLGTANLIESVREARFDCPILVVTSDKCYENREWCYGYRETDPLGGHDVYSASKAMTELVVQAWRRSFFDHKLGPIVTARAGNVIGGGDYASDRIVPDAIRSLNQEQPIRVRNPIAIRPWQHVLECLSGYLWLGALMAQDNIEKRISTEYNFGPYSSAQKSVKTLVKEILKHWDGQWTNDTKVGELHEAGLLTLNIDRASTELGWTPIWEFSDAVKHTMAWYIQYYQHVDMRALTLNQILTYVDSARKSGAVWSNDGN